ncbi:MAG: hypothetical protein R3330_12620 [Saprospiraceae bacterium]|nr:hypothetical protein [Saprospiraceae bacterium]
MKKSMHILWLLLLVPLLASAQDAPQYTLFENFYLTPKNGHAAKLEAAMKAHNKKWHGPGAYQAQVYSVMNGPNAGKLVWSMGPSSWERHENRPQDAAHDSDWDMNIAPHIESYDATDYFSLDPEISYFPGPFDLNRLRLWMIDLNDGKENQFRAFMKRITKVAAENDSKIPHGVYWRQFAGTNPPDVGIVWFFDSLEWFDQESPFPGWYDAMYGEGAFELMIDEWEGIRKSVDVEIWTFDPDMSGHDGKGVNRASGN